MAIVKPFALKYVAFPRDAASKLSIPALGLYVHILALKGEVTEDQLIALTRHRADEIGLWISEIINAGYAYGDSDHIFITDYQN